MNQKLTIVLAAALLAGCTGQVPDAKSEGEKLMQVSRDWAQAAASRDTEKTLSYWADDATVISAGDMPPIKGKQAIRQMVEGSFKSPGFAISWAPQSAEVSKAGDMGYLIEDTKISFNDSTGKTITRNYKGVTIWKKQSDGSWKDVVDMLSPLPEQK